MAVKSLPWGVVRAYFRRLGLVVQFSRVCPFGQKKQKALPWQEGLLFFENHQFHVALTVSAYFFFFFLLAFFLAFFLAGFLLAFFFVAFFFLAGFLLAFFLAFFLVFFLAAFLFFAIGQSPPFGNYFIVQIKSSLLSTLIIHIYRQKPQKSLFFLLLRRCFINSGKLFYVSFCIEECNWSRCC